MKRPSKPPQPYPFTEEQISAKAKALWEQRGADSTDTENWQDAIQALKREQAVRRVTRPLKRLWWKTGLGTPLQRWWRWTGLREKKGWDLATSISIPLVLFLGSQYFTSQNNDKQQTLADERTHQERQLADDKSKQDTLVKYLDQMADSLQHGLLKAKPGDDQFIVAQSRTVLALQSLDRKRQHLVIQFLIASGLNERPDGDWRPRDKQGQHNPLPAKSRVLLYRAQLSKANLINSDLSGAVLLGANLDRANLGCHPLESQDPGQCSDLSLADLRRAKLNGANLSHADLSEADLSGANLYGANLRSADLTFVRLSSANLSNANLSGAVLLSTDLRQAKGLTTQQLEGGDLSYLCGVALPQGLTVNPNRDCDRLPPFLLRLYPEVYKTLKDVRTMSTMASTEMG